MKELIKKIIQEVSDDKLNRLNQVKEGLIELVNNEGLIEASKFVGGYKTLKKILKGTDYLNRDIMLKTIINFCKERGGFSMGELGLEEIKLNESNGLLRQLSYIDKNGIEITSYEKNEDGEYDEEPEDYLSFNYDSKFRNGNYVLDTIHLYEILDAVMEIENKNQ
jgi:hypothetical protein